jgi:hypothetical protein
MHVALMRGRESKKNRHGIFSGKADKMAVLLFDSERSRWRAEEEWHPQQRGIFTADGSSLFAGAQDALPGVLDGQTEQW